MNFITIFSVSTVIMRGSEDFFLSFYNELHRDNVKPVSHLQNKTVVFIMYSHSLSQHFSVS